MRHIILITAIVLTGCATPVPVPVSVPKLPNMPGILREPCEQLASIERKSEDQPYDITDILKPTIENYRRAIECKIKHQATVDWYDGQRTIFNSVK